MKSPMIEAADWIEDKAAYSEMKVMRSPAGWYVGTTVTEFGRECPGSRDSGYFATEAEAAGFLAMVESVPPGVAAGMLRMTP